MAAELSWIKDGESRHTQLRILGDDTRGYLLMGAFEAAGDREYWFATLDEAIDEAAALGVPHAAWSDVTQPSDVTPEVRRPVRADGVSEPSRGS